MPGLDCLAHFLGWMRFRDRHELNVIYCATSFCSRLGDLLSDTLEDFRQSRPCRIVGQALLLPMKIKQGRFPIRTEISLRRIRRPPFFVIICSPMGAYLGKTSRGMKRYSLLLGIIIAAVACSSLLAQERAALQPNVSVLSILQGNAGKTVECT